MQGWPSRNLANQYPLADCAWLATRLPKTECWLFSAISCEHGIDCDKCKTKGVQLIGAIRRCFTCPHCDTARITRHMEAFDRAKEGAASEFADAL
jgi:predicted RNA-binding Zn-ribbon protein involved in translation (DUF1610 family)